MSDEGTVSKPVNYLGEFGAQLLVDEATVPWPPAPASTIVNGTDTNLPKDDR